MANEPIRTNPPRNAQADGGLLLHQPRRLHVRCAPQRRPRTRARQPFLMRQQSATEDYPPSRCFDVDLSVALRLPLFRCSEHRCRRAIDMPVRICATVGIRYGRAGCRSPVHRPVAGCSGIFSVVREAERANFPELFVLRLATEPAAVFAAAAAKHDDGIGDVGGTQLVKNMFHHLPSAASGWHDGPRGLGLPRPACRP